MEITFTFNKKDVQEYARYVVLTRRQYLAGYLLWTFLGPAGVWAAGWLIGLPPDYLWLMVLILGIWWNTHLWSSLFRSYHSVSHIPGYFDPQTVRITDKGLFRRTTTAEVTWYWNGIQRIETTRRHIYVFQSDGYGYSIPRRAFGDPVFADRFYDAILEARNRHTDALLLDEAPQEDRDV